MATQSHDKNNPELRPSMRGVLHQYAFFVALVATWALVSKTPDGNAKLPVIIYGVTLCGLFGVSAMYHRIIWSWRTRPWVRRADHTMIFIFIAGTYTPFALASLDSRLATGVLWFMWISAGLGAILKLLWIHAPTSIATILYIAVGWSSVLALPAMLSALGPRGALLVIIGGLIYTVGGIIHAIERPNPDPEVFGYHEIFHACVILGAAAHYAAIWGAVVPSTA